MLTWQKLGAVDADSLHNARNEAHQAIQWIARAAYGYNAPAADDSHATLSWHPTRRRLESQP